ncbi:unnamed protein product [Closterium sp. NIES-54]
MHSRLLVSGLPRSLPPLPPLPAPPCLPCVEGRQRTAPHSSSFPPMTAPLQTLHMDMWGPACVSGQGRERYFLLVVDDYTRYTMVFPLCSKGEVVDGLIPWTRTVLLQLRERFGQDLPDLRLHSDRGGEFSSDHLRDFCRGEGITQSFTLPDSPQKNGIAECRIGLVMEVARTSMIHAVNPHFLWPFVVWYAAHQLNLWPRVSLPETSPILRWTGKVGDASVFRVWGSRAFVRDTSAGKLSARAGSGGSEPEGVEPGGSAGASPPMSLQQLREWLVRRPHRRSGAPRAGRAGDTEAGGAAVPTGAIGTSAGAGVAGVGGPSARGAGAAGAGVGGTGARGAGAAGVGTVDPGAGGAGDTVWPRPYFVPLLQQVLGVPPSPGHNPPLLCPPPDQSQQPLQPTFPLPAFSPYTEQSGGLTERCEPASRPVLPVRTAHRAPRSRPPLVPGAHTMALRPSSVPLRVPLPAPPESSLPELLDFAAACRLDYATALVAESVSASPLSVGGECALSTDVLEDRQGDFECLAATVPCFASMLLAPEGDPDAPDIPTPRSYAEAITGPSALRLPELLASAHSSVYQLLALSSTFGRVRRAECTSGMGLVLGGRGPIVLTGHADASWVDDSATQRSSQGYTFSLGSSYVSSQSTRSSSVLSSSCEAEIYARAMAAQGLRWLTYLQADLGEQPRSPPVLYVDNKAMIALCQEHRQEHRTKQIALRCFLAQELQQRDQLRLAYVATWANTADVFTKALPPSDYQRFATMLGLVPTLPHLLTA